MAKKFISYNGRIVSDNLSLKLLGQDVSPQPTPPSDFTNCKSLVFDGTDDFVNIGTTSLGITNAISISAWVKIPTTNTGGGGSNIQEIICEDATSGSNRNWALNWRGTGYNKWQWVIWNTNGSVTVVESTGLTPNDNQWHHLFATYDGTSNANGLKLYVDGGTPFTATASSTGIRSTPSVEATIGATSGGGALRLEGTLDEIAVWNSDQSTNASTIYNSGVPNDLSTLNPLSWWRMGDGDTFPTLTDNGSGGNNGTMTNMSSDSIVYDVPLFNTKSILFDGADDYVDCGDNDNLSFGNGTTDSPFSISGWIKMNDISGFRLLNKYVGSTYEYQFGTGAAGNLQLYLLDSSSQYRARLQSTFLNTGQWYHIVATYSGVGGINAQDGIKIYVDGVRVDDTSVSVGNYVAMNNTTVPVHIGKLNTSYTDGNIDEVSIFNTELSASDVTTIYNSGVPNNISSLSPLSWWRMGDGDTFPTLIDRGSGGNNGTMTNMVSTSIVDDVPLYSNKSFEFDGVDDYISCGDNDNLSFGNGTTDSPFSISTWIKIGQTTAQGIVTKYGSSTGTREYLFYTTGGKLRLLLWGNGTNNFATGTSNLSINTWYHVACTYDGRGGSTAYNGITLYINGVAESVTTSGGGYTAMSNTSQNVEIGKHLTNELLGNIDETAIFNTELSASDVTAIYNNGVPNDISCLSPLSWWRMGEDATFDGTNWSLVDNGSGGNDGTSQNMGLSSISNDVPPSDWTPTNVNTVAWIDASDTGSYTTAGSTLTSVTDKAGTYTMNIGNTPTVVSGGLNSLNVFDFDGNGEYLQSSTYSNQTSSGNHWAIGVFLADFVNADKESFWSYETNQSPKRDYAISSAGGGSNSWPGELDLDALSSNRISSTIGNLQDWNLQSVSIDSWVIVSCWFNKTGNQIGTRVNGNNAYTPVNDYDNSISPNQELRLMRNRASQELDGRLAEFFAVADVTGTGGTDLTDLEKAEGYLAWKWGLEGNLPISHPYKNSPPT